MKGLAFSSLRVGEKYRLTNFGERFEFEVIEIIDASEFVLKDSFTLEKYHMTDLVKFGRGNDFEIRPC